MECRRGLAMRILSDRSFFRFVTMHAFDRGTDRRTDRQTNAQLLYRYTASAFQVNAVGKIVSLRPDEDQHNKPKTKNKTCQTKSMTKTIFCWSKTGFVIRQSLRPHQWFIVLYSCSASAVQCAGGIGHSVDFSWVIDVSG